MTEALPHPPPVAAAPQSLVPLPIIESLQHHIPPIPLVSEETVDDDDGEIACICGLTSDDGATVQCDKCLRWQHISCYYPPPKEVPDDDQKHYCAVCVPQPDLDARKAAERQRQRRALEHRNSINGVKRPAAKIAKKKVKESPSLAAQANGWSDRHHLQNHDRKSASPRDQPPPAKKPKTSHRSTNSISQAASRKRGNTLNNHSTRSPSKSPELNTSAFIPVYSDEFLHLFPPESSQIETTTNLLDNIKVTALLNDWLSDPDAVIDATGGKTQAEIFKRWDGQIEGIPGQPETNIQWVEDHRFACDGLVPRWARLVVSEPIQPGTFLGELRGKISLKDDYVAEADNRWSLLHHPEPFVFFHPQLPICVDARQEGSLFRFVRRSCQPNSDLQIIITEQTAYHFCFMAKTEILPGEEVTVAWQVPETIRDRIGSSLATSNNFQPNVRDYISTWVSNVLANCGPCACNGQGSCLMAHYDRRGRTPPLPATKPSKRKKKLPTLDTGSANRSRSASEVRKTENDEDGTDSRSVTGSNRSGSRDNTPHLTNGHTGIPELSEREKKKLQREEEMFRKQEEESGKPKKKRHSAGSALTPSGAGPSKANGTSKYTDAGTSSRPPLSSRNSGSKRKASTVKMPRKESAMPPRVRSIPYVDACVQCDLEASEANNAPQPPRTLRRYVSVSQRLLKRCFSNNFKKSISPQQPSPPAEVNVDAMDVDIKETKETKPEPSTADETGADIGAKASKLTLSDSRPPFSQTAVDGVDTAMPDAQPDHVAETAVKTESPPPKQATPISPGSSPTTTEVLLPPRPKESEPAPTSPSTNAKVSSSETTHPKPLPLNTNVAVTDRSLPVHMHLDMPPPPTHLLSHPISASAGAVQSPTAITPGPMTAPLFGPAVAAAAVTSPSPVRKKMSLSDYTKRSKAARESSGAETSSGLARELKDENISPVSATAEEAAEAEKAVECAPRADEASEGKKLDGPTAQALDPEKMVEEKQARDLPANGDGDNLKVEDVQPSASSSSSSTTAAHEGGMAPVAPMGM